MKVERHKIESIRIGGIKNLDPITVYLHDIAPRQGKITIECYGQSWSAYWGGMGDCNIAAFFCGCDNGYLIGNLAGGIQSHVMDYDNLDQHLCRKVLERRRSEELTADHARELWDDLIDTDMDGKTLLHSAFGNEVCTALFGEDWYLACPLPVVENPDYIYLSRIVDAVKAALKLPSEKAAA